MSGKKWAGTPAVIALELCGLIAACGSSPRQFGGAGAGGRNGGGAAGTSFGGGGTAGSAGHAGTSAAAGDSGSSGDASDAGSSGDASDVGGGGSGRGGSGGSPSMAGTGGLVQGGGASGSAGKAGTAGTATTALSIDLPNLATGKTYVAYSSSLTASGGASYSWSLTSGALPAGLSLQSATSATLKLVGMPSEAGLFPLTFSVTDGENTASAMVTLAITHSVLFLSDRNAPGVNELFLTEVGAAAATTPTRLNLSFPSGSGISSYAWSPDSGKVLYLAMSSAGGVPELWVATLAAPGSPARVSRAGTAVTSYAWLAAGNIGAYSTAAANTYLVDLSGASPGPSQVVPIPPVTGFTAQPGSLYPSPVGTSLVVLHNYPATSGQSYFASNYVTWGAGTPTSTTVIPRAPDSLVPTFSSDGKFFVTMASNVFGLSVWDIAADSPANARLAYDGRAVWSPNSNVLLDAETFTVPAPNQDLFLRTLSGTTWTSKMLVPRTSCSPMQLGPWSPDGRNALIRCAVDVRGISGVQSAALSSDFTLLPTGFLQNAFTDIPTLSWSSDSQWVALRADRDTDAVYDLYLVRWSAPGTASKPYTTAAAQGITRSLFSPNSKALALVGAISPQTTAGLYLSNLPATGSPGTATLASAANALVQDDVAWLPGSRVILYRAAGGSATQLYSVPVSADGTAGSATPVSGVSGTGVSSYQVAPSH